MKKGNYALLFIFITVLIDIIGIGIMVPVIPDLLKDVTGMTEIKDIVRWGIYLTAAYAIMQFLFAPAMGELSDRFGRRPLLLGSLLGMGADYVIMAFAPTLGWLFFGRIFAGIFGSSHSVATAYIADISTKENKAKNFGLLGAAFGLGFVIGPGIGGIFGDQDPRLPFLIAAGLSTLNFFFGLFVLPESLTKERRRPIELKKMIPGRSLLEVVKFRTVLALIAAYFMAYLGGQVMPAIWSFFSKEVLVWKNSEIGYSLMAVGLLAALVQGMLVGPTVKRFGKKRTIVIGFTCWTVGMTLYAFTNSTWMMYAFMLPYILGGVATPTIQSILSDQVSEKEQGQLQGALTGLMSLTAIIGPLLFGMTFDFFIGDHKPFYFPGAPFAVGAVILFFGLVMANAALGKMNVDQD